MKATKVDMHEVLIKFRNEGHMSDIEWRRFCRKYYKKDTSTVAKHLEMLYGKMPKNVNVLIQNEIEKYI